MSHTWRRTVPGSVKVLLFHYILSYVVCRYLPDYTTGCTESRIILLDVLRAYFSSMSYSNVTGFMHKWFWRCSDTPCTKRVVPLPELATWADVFDQVSSHRLIFLFVMSFNTSQSYICYDRNKGYCMTTAIFNGEDTNPIKAAGYPYCFCEGFFPHSPCVLYALSHHSLG